MRDAPTEYQAVPARTVPQRHRPRSRRVGVALGALAALVAGSALTAPSAAEAQPVRAPLVDSTWTTVRAPDAPQSDKPYLSTTASEDATYLTFDVSAFAGSAITSGALQLTVDSTASNTGGFVVYPVASSWRASDVTARNHPARLGGAVTAGTTKAVAGRSVIVPLGVLSQYVQAGRLSLEVHYSQRFVGTVLWKHGVKAPTLTVQAGSSTGAVPVPPVTAPVPAPPVATPAPPVAAPVVPQATVNPKQPSYRVAQAGSTTKKVFAHYFPPYPLSLTNQPPAQDYYARNYLTVGGENGKHALYGGLLRDRPIPRAPLGGDWQVTDLKTEVNQAADAGIDGFTVNVLSLSGQNWATTTNLMKAAADSGRNFVVVPNLDMTASAGKSSQPDIASHLAQLFASPSAYRLSDGRYVLSTFNAEQRSPEWWTGLKSILKNQYGYNIALIAVLLDANPVDMARFAPVVYAEGEWGTRNPQGIMARPNHAAEAHALGVKWMSAVAVQDVRPNQGVYAEADNAEALRDNWSRAMSDGADLVQLTTWNDYSENTSFAPSIDHKSSFLDVSGYYLTQFKTGKAPAITSDSMVITHRNQFAAARPSEQPRLMTPNLGSSRQTPRDDVEVFTFLTAPAQVTVTIGGNRTTYAAGSGVFIKTLPLALGTVSATAVRGSATILNVTSPYRVTATPTVQNLQYYGVDSRDQ